MKVDAETEWTPVTGWRRFRSNTLDPAVVEETKRLRSTGPTSDTSDNTKMDEETRKRALVESHVILCFDQIKFINRVGMPLVMPIFSGQVLPGFV